MLSLAVMLVAGTLFAGLGISYYMDLLSGNQTAEKMPTLIIEAKDLKGHPLSMYVYLENESGYTPFKFYGTGLQNATVTNFDAFIFDHWEDGNTARSNIIELDDGTTKTITAIYR
jgi:hypothetical protein